MANVTISLPEGNLYTNGKAIQFDNEEQLLVRDLIDYQPTERDKYITIQGDDELTLIAYVAYSGIIKNASKYWWIIADANNVINPLDLTERAGDEFVIPEITNFKLLL